LVVKGMRSSLMKWVATGLMVLSVPALEAGETTTYPILPGVAVWQWFTLVPGAVSQETKAAPRAFLWIPPHCRRVRGVVVGQHNMEEETILEHPQFRKALADLDFAAVWITPALGLVFHGDAGPGERFEAMMKDLAGTSGYEEIAMVPVVPIGHSAAASFPWSFAAWKPERTLAAISISGQWPFVSVPDQPELPAEALDGVPGLVAMGEYEWASDRAGEGLKARRGHPRHPLAFLAEPGGGHFDVSAEKVAFCAFYLKKAAQYRLPVEPGQPMRFIDPTREGWLVDRWRINKPRTAHAGPVGSYKGDAGQAFWCFDEETARAVEAFGAQHRGKIAQLVGCLQQGVTASQDKNTHQQVTLPFLPEADGITFKLQGAFLNTVPEGRPVKWTQLPAGSPVGHATGGGPVVIDRICGPVAQLGPDTFQIAFDRLGFDNPRRSSEIWLMASHPGDGEYKRAVQQAVLRLPLQNREGMAQRITFDPIPDQKQGARVVKLQAHSDSGEKVRFYVREGPAQVEGDVLRLTEIPPRSKSPMKVTVVAWQWGRSIEPKLQTAEPVGQTFEVMR
jgi:hypothetical protein